MATDKIFTNWDKTHSDLWSHLPIRLEHEMHKSPAFSMNDLARLIEGYPRKYYNIMQTGPNRVWKEGDIGTLSGSEVISAIAAGELWLNLREVGSIDRRYNELVDRMFKEIATEIPSFQIPEYHQEGILISSPRAQVHYHADLPWQILVQIAGRKRVFIYPNTAPFITQQHLEDITLFNKEVDLPYRSWYDRHAQVFDLEPGQMLNWPLNTPHRVENLDSFCVSMTISYEDDKVRRAHAVNFSNGMLRHRFGYQPRSQNLHGPSYFAKRVMRKFLINGSWIRRERNARSPIEFTLDETQRGNGGDQTRAA